MAQTIYQAHRARISSFRAHVATSRMPTAVAENTRHRQKPKRGRKRLLNAEVTKRRFTDERSFAWGDKFGAWLIRFDRKNASNSKDITSPVVQSVNYETNLTWIQK